MPLVRDYVAEYQKHHKAEVSLIIEVEEFEGLSAASGIQLIRIIQEALHNVRKHAQASQVTIRLETDADQLCLCIEDDGLGFDPKQIEQEKRSSFGLEIMRERAKSIGGTLEINSKPNQGTQLRVWIPDV